MKLFRLSLSFSFLLVLSLHMMGQPVPATTITIQDDEFVNEQFCFTADLSLSGDPGYGPYVRVMVPPDVTVNSISFLGTSLTYTKVGAFPSYPLALADPISTDSVKASDGAVAGDTLFVARLPVGSMVATTPDLTVSLCVTFNDEATIDSNYTFTVQPGLEFGDTPTGDNGPVYGAASTGQSKPKILEFTKDNNAPEEERPPGPDWPFTYTLAIDVANLKTVTSLSFEDVLPANLTWVGNLTTSGGTGCAASYTPGTRTVSATCSSVTGTENTDEVTISFDVYIQDILDETNCNRDTIYNAAYFTGIYNAVSITPDSARDTLEVEHFSIQTTVSPSQVLPDDTVTYTTVFQFTDFDSTAGNLNPVNSLLIEEVLPGGVSFDDSYTPTISLSGGTTLAATSITPVVDTISGDTIRLRFDVHAVTGDIAAGTAGTLIYKALIRQHFDIPGTDPLLARDALKKNITATYNLSGKASNCEDGSSATARIQEMTPSLTILNAPANGSCYVPREVVTFKLTLTIPSGDTEGIIFDNYFPLPVFDVSDLDTDNFGTSYDIRLAPDHSDGSFVPTVANITKDTDQNSLRVVWPDLSGATVSRTLSIYVDLPIDYQPFDNGLYLSNLFRYQTQNSKASTIDSTLIVYLNLCAPDVEIYKGISATSGGGTLSPPALANPVTNDVENLDAGDQVTFVLTAVNAGGAKAYDVIVKDSIPSGVTNCTLIGTDPVKYGDGTVVSSGEYAGSPFDASGMTLDSLYANGDASSRDTVSVTCTCDIVSDIPPDTTFYNYGKTQWRSAPLAEQPTANQFTLATDSASLKTGRPVLTKTLSGISPNGAGSLNIISPGDTLTYQLGITLPEGEIPALVVADTLPVGLTYVSGSVVVDNSSFTGTVTTSPSVTTSGDGTSGNPQTVGFTFGNTTVSDNDDTTDDSLTLTLKAVVLDNAANNGIGSLQEKVNQAQLTYTNLSGDPVTATDTIDLGEPDLAISLVMNPISAVDGGDVLTFTLTVDNNGTTPAYDITVSDDLDGLDDFLDLTSISNTTGSMGSWVFGTLGSVVSYTLSGSNTLAADGQQVFTFTVELDDNVTPATTYQTQASVSGDNQENSPTEQRTTSANSTDDLTTSSPIIAKTLSSVSPDGTGTGGTSVTAGDTVIYTISVTLTEGTTADLAIIDTLPPGFQYSDVTISSGSFGGSVSGSPTVATSGSLSTGEIVSFTFSGNTTTTGDNNTANNTFDILAEIVVMDNSANSAQNTQQSKTNTVVLQSSTLTGNSISDSYVHNFAEPKVTVNKWIDTDTLDAGDSLTVELRVQNKGTSMAHDIVVLDTLDGNLFDLSGVTLVNAYGFTYSYTSPYVKFTKDTLTSAEGRIDLEFKVAVKTGVTTGTTFENVGRVIATTQTGTPPEERSKTRTNTENIYTEGVPAMVKTLINSTDVNTGISEATIGEILTYQVAITIPEGLTKENGTDPMVTDTLPVGFQYTSSPSQSAAVYAVADYNGGEIITSTAGTLNGSPQTITPSVSGSAATGQILGFDLGDITNNDDQVGGDADAEQVILTYEVLVLNTSDNNAGDEKANIAAFQYQDGDGNNLSTVDTLSLTVVEPNLGMSTVLTPSGGTASGMNTVSITTRFYNSNVANATTGYNFTLSDDLPSGFLGTSAGANAPNLSSASYTGDASDISACFEWGGDGNEVLFDGTNLGCSLDSLNPGDTIVLVYEATIDSLTNFNATLTTNPSATITTLDGATGIVSVGGYAAGTADADDGERTGTGNTNTSGQSVNDLSTTVSDNVSLIEPSLSKTGDTNLAIGDSATMTITVALPGGTASALVVTDDLPAGLAYTADGVSFTWPSGVYADTPSPSTATDDDPVVWNFGTVTNHNASVQNLVIQYEVETRNVLGNQAGTDLANIATLTYSGSSTADSLTDSATVSMIEPNLTIEIEDGGGTYGAGSTIPYTIRIINANNQATAYGVDFSSVIPAELLGGTADFYDNINLTNTSNSVLLTGTSTAVSGGDVSLGTSVNTGDQLSLASFDLPPGDTLIITFESTVINNVTAGGSFAVNASADYNSLLNNDSRGRNNSTNPGTVDDDNDADLNNYEESGSTTSNLTATLAIVKALNSLHNNNDFTIGDSILYDIRVALPEGITNSVIIVDSLPDGLGFIDATRSGGVNMSFNTAMTHDGVVGNAGKFTFDLKNVTNTADGDITNDTLTLTLNVQVLDDGTNNVDGNTQDNQASVTSSINLTVENSNTLQVDIVEPGLTVGISPSNATPSLGEEVTFTITVDNTGNAIAHDIDLASVLRNLSLTYSGTFTANGSGFSLDGTDPDSLVFSADQLAVGGSVSFSFTAKVDSSSTLDSALTVPLALTSAYDSQDGNPTSPWTERSYDISTNTTVTPTLHMIDAKKTVVYTDANTNNQLDPGETLTYTVILTNNTGAATTNTVFTDVIPAEITYTNSSLTTTSGTVDDGSSPILTVNLGTISAGSSDTISFQATVNAGLADGMLISNQGSANSDQTEPEPTDVDGVDENGDQPTDIWVGSGRPLEHMLYAPKVVSWLTDTDGSDDVTVTDIMRYTFILENQGNTQLTNVSLTDNLPAGLSLSAAGTPSEGSLTTGSYPSISWTGITLEVGEIATLSLDVSIDAFGGASQTFSNQGTANSDQTSSVSTDGNGSPLDGNQPTVFQAVNSGTAAPDIDVEKRWVQTLDTDEDGLVDPTDRYRYLITISNSGSASATDVLFADAAPTNTVLAGDSVFTSQGIVLSETSADIQVNIGTLPPGGIATVSFEVSPSSSSDGDLVPNQATIVSPEVNGGLALSSDDNADDDDGLNPTQTPIHTGSGTLDAADLTKTLTATSEGASSGTNVYIGEVLTYEIEIVVPKGYVYDAAILDTLPEGLRYVSGTATLSRTFGTGLHASENPGSINAASSGSTVNLTDGTDVSIGSSRYIRLFLGDLINSDTDGTAETYTLAFQVVVSNESGIGNDAGQSLTNDGTFTYLDGINQSQTLATASDPTVTIFEPNVAISQAASSAWMLTAGGVIEYTLTITNPSGSYVSTAYDLVVTDSIPFDADEWESMSLESTSGTGTTGGITNNSDLVNGQLNIAVDSLPAGETLTLVFRATADGDPEITTETDSMNNITWVTATSLPGAQGSGNSSPGAAGAINGERTSGGDYPDSDYQYADTTTLTIYDLDFSKSILNPQAYYAIGDTITYQLSIAVPDGVTVGSNVIEDALPAGLTYITSSLTTASGNDYPAAIVTDPGTDFTRVSTSPDTLRLSLGTISNSTGTADTILMTYWAWVANDLNNQYNAGTVSGTELENQAKEQFSNPVHPDAAFTDTLNDSTSAYVGEPYISISNSITSGDANPGGTMYFSVTVSNTGSNTAYDVNVQDVATQYLENIADLTVAATTGGASGPSGFTNNNTNWESSNFDIPAGGSVTITFSAEIASDAPLGTMDPNTVTVRFSSQPGSGAPVERDSTSGGNQDDLINLNNYIAAKDPTTDLIVFPIELLDFRARWMNDLQIDAKIEWVTATELNNDFFLVERSMDGQFWLEVGKVDGAGNSQIEKTYELEDKKVGFIIPGNSVFYRLKQVDFDGKFAYSSRIELLFDKDHENLVVWPNPFEGSLQVALLGDWQAEKMTLIDGAGRIVHVHEVSQTANRQRIQIPGLESLAAGTYYLVVELVNGEKKMAKVTKAD